MAAVSQVPTMAPAGNAGLLELVLSERMARRGWQFRAGDTSVTAHRPEWPLQLCVLVREAEMDAEAMLGIALELGAMPLRGERFRDIFNSDREEILRNYGNFTLRQATADGDWLRPVNGRSFMHGMSDGISRKTRLAVFDRADEGTSLAETFALNSQRFLETGSEIASLLQRLYQRTVLSTPASEATLPDIVRPSMGMLPLTADSDTAYPWRR